MPQIVNTLPALGDPMPSVAGLVQRVSASAAAAYSVASNIFNIRYATTGLAYSESNARVTWSSSVGDYGAILIVPKGGVTGAWFIEFDIADKGSQTIVGILGLSTLPAATIGLSQTANGYGYVSTGSKANNAVTEAYGKTYTTNDKIAALLTSDSSTMSLVFAKNGAPQGVAYSGIPAGPFIPAVELGSGSTTSVRISVTPTYAFPGYVQWR